MEKIQKICCGRSLFQLIWYVRDFNWKGNMFCNFLSMRGPAKLWRSVNLRCGDRDRVQRWVQRLIFPVIRLWFFREERQNWTLWPLPLQLKQILALRITAISASDLLYSLTSSELVGQPVFVAGVVIFVEFDDDASFLIWRQEELYCLAGWWIVRNCTSKLPAS